MNKENRIGLTLVLVVILSFVGCDSGGKENMKQVDGFDSSEKEIEHVLKYMDDKYKDKFKLASHNPAVWTNSGSSFYLTSESFPDESVYVKSVYSETGAYTLKDDYYLIIKEKEYYDYLKAFSDKHFEEASVYQSSIRSDITLVPATVTDQTPLEKVIDFDENLMPLITVVVPEGSANRSMLLGNLEKIAKEFQDRKIRVWLTMAIVTSEGYEFMRIENRYSYDSKYVIEQVEVTIDKNLQIQMGD